MPSISLPLEKGGAKRILLTWGFWRWRNFTVSFNGAAIGRISGQKELEEGRDFTLPDGSTLSVSLKKALFMPELQVSRNGYPLPGSGSDPIRKLKIAGGIIFLVGGLNVVCGFAALASGSSVLREMGIGAGSCIVGGAFLLLGFLVMKRSALSLGISMALLIFDAALTLYVTARAGGPVPVSGMVIRAFFIIYLFRGFSAIKDLQSLESA